MSQALGILTMAIALVPVSNHAQQPANTTPSVPTGSTNPLGRKSPPQPQLKQSLDYFVGTWNVTWSGRESPFSPGPRTGTMTFERMGSSNFLSLRGEGKSDAGAYKESGTLGWHEGQKIMVLREQLATGADVLSIGDWTSPISIRFESAPVAGPGPKPGPTALLRRTIGIVSPQSFTITDEMSTDGGKTFTKIGGAVVGKK
jgi:hypothetical protein